jgi:dihydroneopterin aldolase
MDESLRDCSQIKAIMEGSPHFLLESVATAIAKAVLEKHPQVSEVRVRVGKPHVAVVGDLDLLGVEIFRNSSQFTK